MFQWFLDRMADDNWWPMQILIKCPNQIVRQVSYLSDFTSLESPFFSCFLFLFLSPLPVDLLILSHRHSMIVFLTIKVVKVPSSYCLMSQTLSSASCLPDVPEVVYSCHPEAASGSRSPLPAARHGGRVCPTCCSVFYSHFCC